MRSDQTLKLELMSKLQEKGINKPKGSRSKLQGLCLSNGIMVTQKVPNVAQGWVSKPKGAFQILFERGWIDPSVDPRKYTWFAWEK